MQVSKCKYSVAKSAVTCTGFVDLPKGNESTLQMAVADIGPIASAVDATHESKHWVYAMLYDCHTSFKK